MKITGDHPFVSLEAYIKNAKDKRKVDFTTKQTSKEVIKEEKIVLSPKARMIQEAKKLLSSVPDVREEKVAQLKKQIKNGSYHIEGKKIAVRMIKESILNELL
jgi:negative regulator of flagellin synthesis FlgM